MESVGMNLLKKMPHVGKLFPRTSQHMGLFEGPRGHDNGSGPLHKGSLPPIPTKNAECALTFWLNLLNLMKGSKIRDALPNIPPQIGQILFSSWLIVEGYKCHSRKLNLIGGGKKPHTMGPESNSFADSPAIEQQTLLSNGDRLCRHDGPRRSSPDNDQIPDYALSYHDDDLHKKSGRDLILIPTTRKTLFISG
jgi:hypothetical protein